MYFTLLKIQQFFEGLYQSMISFLRVLFRMRFRSGFKNLEPGNSKLILLANGPSLKEDLEKYAEKLASAESMAVNFFALDDAFLKIRPRHYVILDINFFKEDRILERVREARDKLFDVFRNKLDWNMNLYIPSEARKSHFHKELADSDIPLNIVFFNRTSIDGLKPLRHCMYSRGWGMPPPQNVLIGALMAAIQTGFRTIYILGADHSWHRDISIKEDNSLEITDRHFYNPEGKNLRKHHGESLEQLGLTEFFHELTRTFRSHKMIESYAKTRGVEILNASSVSYIDAYRKIRIEDIPWD